MIWRLMSARGLAVALPLALVAGCMVGPDYKTPKAKVAGQYMTNPVVSGNPPSNAEVYWWRNFNDPTLERLVQLACSNNLSLQIAGVRVLQARAQLSKSIGDLFPQQQAISGEIQYARLRSPSTELVKGFTPDYATDQFLFGASWEIDVWGKIRRAIEANRATYLGTVASYDDALVTLIADVAKNYVSLRTTEERIRVAVTN